MLKESTLDGRNGWYEACDQLGQTANFVTDIAKAWKWAEWLYETEPSLSLALQVRYALITATLNSLAQNTPAELISIFVEKKFWPPAQGLAYVKQIQNPRDCADAVSKLIECLPEELYIEALQVARDIQDESSRASALSGLAPHLDQEQLSEALSVARDIQVEYYRADALGMIAFHLDEEKVSFELWQKTFHCMACNDRKNFLQSLSMSGAAAIYLSGRKRIVIKYISDAIQDVCTQWR